jgi:hypothetical protein
VAVVCSWPLPLHLDSHLTGELSGDTGVYVWNQWVFRHELVAHGSLPLYTSTIFSATGLADLSLHNYTIFADLLAFPLIPWLGVVTTFNVVFLILSVLTAWTTFVLVRHVTAHTAASWVAGALFAWSPILVARSTAHFSLVAAAPLPVFIWCLLRMAETGRARFAVGAGATTAWAVTCDVYYGVYCAVIAVVFLATQLLRLRLVVRDAGNRVRAVTERVLDGVVLAIVMLASFVGVTGGAEWTLGSARISIHTLYTPMLVCTVLLAAKLLMHSGVRVVLCEQLPRVPWLFTTAVATCVILLSPVLVSGGAARRGWICWPSSCRTRIIRWSVLRFARGSRACRTPTSRMPFPCR